MRHLSGQMNGNYASVISVVFVVAFGFYYYYCWHYCTLTNTHTLSMCDCGKWKIAKVLSVVATSTRPIGNIQLLNSITKQTENNKNKAPKGSQVKSSDARRQMQHWGIKASTEDNKKATIRHATTITKALSSSPKRDGVPTVVDCRSCCCYSCCSQWLAVVAVFAVF